MEALVANNSSVSPSEVHVEISAKLELAYISRVAKLRLLTFLARA